MADRSAIEWTATYHEDGTVTPGATWNPLLGCTKVSEGCRGCYAIPQAWMKQFNQHEKVRDDYEGLVEKRPDGSLNWTGRINLLPDRLETPLHWREPRRIFVNSLSDLFHEQVPDEFIDRVFGVMALAQQHTFQVLTKRPERMAEHVRRLDTRTLKRGAIAALLPGKLDTGINNITSLLPKPHQATLKALADPILPNVWLGTSTEDQRTADERIPHLLATPAAVRFLSCEPLLGPINLHPWVGHWAGVDFIDGPPIVVGARSIPNRIAIPKLHWVIAGGESGPNFRPLDLDWARSLRNQCQAAGVAFSFKQVGGRTPKAGGRLLDGRTHDEYPAVAAAGATS